MNELANNPLEKRNEEHYENLKVAKAWIKSLMEKIEFETTPVKWISMERTRSSIRDDEWREQHHNASGTKE